MCVLILLLAFWFLVSQTLYFIVKLYYVSNYFESTLECSANRTNIKTTPHQVQV